jgi:hypothetical protein
MAMRTSVAMAMYPPAVTVQEGIVCAEHHRGKLTAQWLDQHQQTSNQCRADRSLFARIGTRKHEGNRATANGRQSLVAGEDPWS